MGFCSISGLSVLNAATKKVSDLEESLVIAKRKRLHAVREKTRASIRNMQQNNGNVRNDDPNISVPMQSSRTSVTAALEKSSQLDMFVTLDSGSCKERRPGNEVSPTFKSSTVEKVRTEN